MDSLEDAPETQKAGEPLKDAARADGPSGDEEAPSATASSAASASLAGPATSENVVGDAALVESSGQETSNGEGQRPTFVFFGVVAAISLIADIGTKVWAEIVMNQRGFEPLALIEGHLEITLAYNRGGAWGLLAGHSAALRLPFFLGVSVLAILFIISLYGRLHAEQRALKWGLPLVLGGALGNLNDRITRTQVIDFIDYQAEWVMKANSFVHEYVPSWSITNHWPTFNVADIAIVVGVALMAVDMFSHGPKKHDGSPSLNESPTAPGGTEKGVEERGPDTAS